MNPLPTKPIIEGCRTIGTACTWEGVVALLMAQGASEYDARQTVNRCGIEGPGEFELRRRA